MHDLLDEPTPPNISFKGLSKSTASDGKHHTGHALSPGAGSYSIHLGWSEHAGRAGIAVLYAHHARVD
jgi:hypothetical protein